MATLRPGAGRGCHVIARVFSISPALENIAKADGGFSNAGIYCYTVRRAFGERRFVEKRTNNSREVHVARLLLGRSSRWPSVFPKIYRVIAGHEHTRIFMEYIEGVGATPALSEPVAAAVTRSMLRLQRIFRGAELERVPVSVGGLVHSLKKTELDQRTKECLVRALERNLPSYNTCTRVVCHSDVFWPNLSMRGWPQAPSCRLIDLGFVGRNMLGSDLHHFFRSSMRVPAERPFYSRLVTLTAEAFNADPASVDLAARFYALFRSASTVRRRLDSGDVAGARLEAEVCLRIDRRFA